jgi:hypothetical protein
MNGVQTDEAVVQAMLAANGVKEGVQKQQVSA